MRASSSPVRCPRARGRVAAAVMGIVLAGTAPAACAPSGSASEGGPASAGLTAEASATAPPSPPTGAATALPAPVTSAPTPPAVTPSTGASNGTGATNGTGGTGGTGGAGTADLSSLRGKVIVIDPGHNGGNASHPAQINRRVFVVNRYKACNTTGTQTGTGYAEHAFAWDLTTRLGALLRAAGARVVLTRTDDTGVGPCITERAAIGNRAQADLVLSVHADGAAASGWGFHVIEPGPVGPNDRIVAPSKRLGTAIRTAFRIGTGEPYATYTARNGVAVRTDLGGLNLSTVPVVFIECGNMRNAGDAGRLSSGRWRQRAARALAAGMADYLAGR